MFIYAGFSCYKQSQREQYSCLKSKLFCTTTKLVKIIGHIFRFSAEKKQQFFFVNIKKKIKKICNTSNNEQKSNFNFKIRVKILWNICCWHWVSRPSYHQHFISNYQLIFVCSMSVWQPVNDENLLVPNLIRKLAMHCCVFGKDSQGWFLFKSQQFIRSSSSSLLFDNAHVWKKIKHTQNK